MATFNPVSRISIPSLIAEYGDEGVADFPHYVAKGWEETRRYESADRLIDRLLNEKVIDFPLVSFSNQKFSLPKTVQLFTEHIRPLLRDIASTSGKKDPADREFLVNLMDRIQQAKRFISIIPLHSATSDWKTGAFEAYRGLPRSEYYAVPDAPTSEEVAFVKSKIDSFGVLLVVDDKHLEILEDKRTGEWHIGTTSLYRHLQHELIHIDLYMDAVFQERVAKETEDSKNYRFTNLSETETIFKENAFASLRGEMSRVGHRSICSQSFYKTRNLVEKLLDALQYGLDGSVRKLLKNNDCFPSVSDPYLNEILEQCGQAYCEISFEKATIKSSVDLAFFEEIITHKNKALLLLIHYLMGKKRFDAARRILLASLHCEHSLLDEGIRSFLERNFKIVTDYKLAELDENPVIEGPFDS